MLNLCKLEWDRGNEYFPPTTWQISNIFGGSGATNVIPEEVNIVFNFRFSTASTVQSLQTKVYEILNRHGLEYDLEWTISGKPYLTPQGGLVEALISAVKDVVGIKSDLSTSGGTS